MEIGHIYSLGQSFHLWAIPPQYYNGMFNVSVLHVELSLFYVLTTISLEDCCPKCNHFFCILCQVEISCILTWLCPSHFGWSNRQGSHDYQRKVMFYLAMLLTIIRVQNQCGRNPEGLCFACASWPVNDETRWFSNKLGNNFIAHHHSHSHYKNSSQSLIPYLPEYITLAEDISAFKKLLKTHYFRLAHNNSKYSKA